MARRGRPTTPIVLTEEERACLEEWATRRKVARDLSVRSRIVLGLARGKTAKEITKTIPVSRQTVTKWRKRFLKYRLDGLSDAPRPGAPRKIEDKKIEEVLRLTVEQKPTDGTQWSRRSMAKKVGVSDRTVGRIWRAFGIKPHIQETFCLSTDPHFVEKVRDVVGIYMNPPLNAIVLCVDEKTQVQALDRRQPLLPMSFGDPEKIVYDYIRHGTTTLFAALDVATGNVIGECYPRHRATEFRKFLGVIDRSVPKELDVHLVVDNYATHKTDIIRDWLAKRPRFHIHFTPTHASWLNQVETWFSLLYQKKLKRGVHTSVEDLVSDIQDFIEAHNDDPTPFVWTKSADEILESIARLCDRILNVHATDD